MKVSVTNPNFTADFKSKVAKAVAKELTADIKDIDEYLFISVYSQGRPVGRFTFNKEEKIVVLAKKFVIEHDYNSFEFAVAELVKYLKNKKYKTIAW